MRLGRTRPWLSRVRWLMFLMGIVVLVAACRESDGDVDGVTAPPATEPPAAVSPTTPPEPPTAVSPTNTAVADAVTAGTLAVAGQQVFAEQCVSCHGEQGEGVTAPAIIGGSRLNHFGTAQGILDFIRLAMPQNAPGSLSDQQYLEVLAFLLLENEHAESDTAIEIERLGEIELK